MTAVELKKSVADKLIDFANSECSRDKEEAKGAVRRDGGRALKAVSLAGDILDSVMKAADEMALKATGNCDICYGKGYSSYIAPGETASSDLPDNEPIKHTVVKRPKLVYRLCKCERGRSLKQLVISNPVWVDPYEKAEVQE